MDEQQSSHPHDPIDWLKYMNSLDEPQNRTGRALPEEQVDNNLPASNEPEQEEGTRPVAQAATLSSPSPVEPQATPSAPTTPMTTNEVDHSQTQTQTAPASATTPNASSPTTPRYHPVGTASNQTSQRRTIMWIALAVLVIIVLYVFLQFNTFLRSGLPFWPTTYQQPNPANTNNNPPAPTVKTFQLAPHTLIVLDGHNSNITVSSANTTTTTITARNHNTNFGPDNATTLHYDQSTNAQGIAQLHIASDPAYKDIDYDITVPAATSLQINTDSGSVSVTGIGNTTIHTTNGGLDLADITGTVNATTDSGDINAHDIKGTTTLQSSSGSIHLTSISGQVNATTQSGDVIATQVALSGQSTLRTTNGSVRVTATLDPHGTYTMETDSGDADLTIPANSAFALNAGTGSGSVHNDFNSTTVGNAPRATITIRVGNGSINVDQGS
jgi:hypothetical protein